MIVEMTKLISQHAFSHAVSNPASVPLFMWTRCLAHLRTGGTCQVDIRTKIADTFEINLTHNVWNEMYIFLRKCSQTLHLGVETVFLFWELRWTLFHTHTHTSSTPEIECITVLQTAEVSGLRRPQNRLYIVLVKMFSRWLTKACVESLLPNITPVTLNLLLSLLHLSVVASSFVLSSCFSCFFF